MTTNHTPPPWHAHDRLSNGMFVRTEEQFIAQMIGDVVTADANAAFIVKAVNCHSDLVEQLSRLLGLYVSRLKDDGCTGEHIESMPHIEDCKTALAKANAA